MHVQQYMTSLSVCTADTKCSSDLDNHGECHADKALVDSSQLYVLPAATDLVLVLGCILLPRIPCLTASCDSR